MKKSILIYTYQAATLLLVLLFVSNSSVFAQRRGSNQSQRTQSRSEIINKKPERENHSRHQHNKARNSRSRYSYSNQDRHSSTHHSHYHYRHKQSRSRKYRQPNHCSNVIVRHNRYVTHPKYGEVVIRFGHPPKLLYHRHGHY